MRITVALLLFWMVAPGGAMGKDPERDWAALAGVDPRLVPPAEWDGKSPSRDLVQKWVEGEKDRLIRLANQARAFVEAHPDAPQATSALRKEFEALDSLDRLVPDAVRERLEQVAQALLKRKDLEEDERFLIEAGRLMRTAKTPEELEAGARKLIRRYPDGQAYEILLSAARSGSPERGRAIAEEIVQSRAPEPVREQARALLKRFGLVGRPLEMKFRATNGRDIDVQQLRGKVVVIDFWATWCGPCVAQLPELKAFYERYRDRVEILGISFDANLLELETFLREQKIPWPQYMDSGGWNSRFASEYAIHSVPTLWLVDKKGILRDLNGRVDLERKVEALLTE